MSEHYPLPAGAAYIWTKGDTLVLSFPPVAGATKGHSVALYADEHGLKIALSILRERETAKSLRVGTRAAPVQYDLDAIGRHIATKGVRKHAGVTVEDLLNE
jgi:hypothetical protein